MSRYADSIKAWEDLFRYWRHVHGSNPVLARDLVTSLKTYNGTLPKGISSKLYNRDDKRSLAMRLGRCLGPMAGIRLNQSGLRIVKASREASTGPALWIVLDDGGGDSERHSRFGGLSFVVQRYLHKSMRMP